MPIMKLQLVTAYARARDVAGPRAVTGDGKGVSTQVYSMSLCVLSAGNVAMPYWGAEVTSEQSIIAFMSRPRITESAAKMDWKSD